MNVGRRIRSEKITLTVKEVDGPWIVGRNPNGNYVLAHLNPHTKRWDSIEWFSNLRGASAALRRRGSTHSRDLRGSWEKAKGHYRTASEKIRSAHAKAQEYGGVAKRHYGRAKAGATRVKESAVRARGTAKRHYQSASRHYAAAKAHAGLIHRKTKAAHAAFRTASDTAPHWAWEVWSRGDEHYGEPGFVEAFKDKAEAKSRIRRLRRSHPYTHYMLKHRKVSAARQFGSRSHSRALRHAR